jgi:hypothetical protein
MVCGQCQATTTIRLRTTTTMPTEDGDEEETQLSKTMKKMVQTLEEQE